MRRAFAKFLLILLMSAGSIFYTAASAPPDEGMWLPMFVERLNYVDMQKMGLQLTAEEIYSINNSSLKDAIVGLSEGQSPSGFFCTAEVVSDKGLLFTNHHCGYDIIQKHSSIDHDYLTDGFWAGSLEEELSSEDLSATFFIRMEDVTDSIIPFLADTMTEVQRSAKIKEISGKMKKRAAADGKYNVVVKGFFSGNEYYLFVYQTFTDVRLVGAPPSAIGKFGGDTDNWMWPRHTGDFSIFRVYTAPDGSPADYSRENIPLKPKHHLPVSLDGVKKNDFTMIWGYPGSTDRYLSSYGVEFLLNSLSPALVELFGQKLEVWKEDMAADREVGIKYASKYAGIANTWKYFIGQTRGLKRLDIAGKKAAQEAEFTAWVNADPERTARYRDVLDKLKSGNEGLAPDFKPLIYTSLAASGGAEIFTLASEYTQLYGLLESKDESGAIEETTLELKKSALTFYKDYNAPTDQKVFARLLKTYYEEMPKELLAEEFTSMVHRYKGDFNTMAAEVFEKTIFANQAKLTAFLDKPSLKTLDKDPVYKLSRAFSGVMMQFGGKFGGLNTELGKYERLYMAGLMEMMPDRAFYPDANSTMRFTYGSVQDYKGADAVYYDYITHLGGVMEKEDPSNEEFIVPAKLKELYENGDFGRYGEDGKLITCFLTTNDITGGNSGSPVINGKGQLIGLAFDGNWEAMSGDIAYEPRLQRTICVDIRYVLFVVDKYAGAQNLIDELTIADKSD
jgi:hypothetical protein